MAIPKRPSSKKIPLTRKPKAKEAAKKKKTKPKHLNRRLESASSNAERERILAEIQALQAIKQQAATAHQKSLDDCLETRMTSDHLNGPSGDFPRETISDVAKQKEQRDDEGAKLLKMQQDKVDEKHDTEKTISGRNQESSKANPMMEDEDTITQNETKRQRGKRRRGRKDTSQLVQEDQKITNEVTDAKKTPRYCLGRKPVTDFEVGQYYTGRIVYAKPFGVFLDIGCHSDAFCHVSRLSDSFVEDVDTWTRAATPEQRVRITDVDRKRKRITVSLQSETRLSDEQASLQAWQQRKRKHSDASKRLDEPKKRVEEAKNRIEEPKKGSEEIHVTNYSESPLLARDNAPDRRSNDPKAAAAELKRQRKLARRAERRALKEQTKDSSEA